MSYQALPDFTAKAAEQSDVCDIAAQTISPESVIPTSNASSEDDFDIPHVISIFNSMLQNGQYHDANRLMLSYDKHYPEDRIIKEHLARSYHYISDFEREATAWLSAFHITLRSEFAVCAIHAWTHARSFKDTSTHISNFATFGINHCGILSAIAAYYDAKGDPGKASTFWKLAISTDNPSNDAFIKYVKSLFHLKGEQAKEADLKEIALILRQALSLYPDDTTLLKFFVDISLSLGTKDAVTALDHLILLASMAPYKWIVGDIEFIELSRRKAWIFFSDNDIERLEALFETLPRTLRGESINDNAFF